jgi:hypothetical protein
VTHNCYPNTWEAKDRRIMGLRPAWAYKEKNLSQKTKQNQMTKFTWIINNWLCNSEFKKT